MVVIVLEFKQVTVSPLGVSLYLPPITWKGDSLGHVGENDTFFWVLEGECFLLIESEAAIIRPGQLAFLPKGKKRIYTHASERFSMYEMAFSAESGGSNLMELLGLTEHRFVVNIQDKEEMSALFERSCRKELFQDPIHQLKWCANIITMIQRYAEAHGRTDGTEARTLEPVLRYMTESLSQNLTTEELAGRAFMQPTYFIRKFKQAFGMPPQHYFRQLKLYQAMHLLVSTDLSIEVIALQVGMEDASYFARFFKKESGVTPREYRNAFKRKQGWTI